MKTLLGAVRCRRKFLRYLKRGFRDETYFDWECGYKERAHEQWLEVLDRAKFKALPKGILGDRAARRSDRVAHQFAFFLRKNGTARRLQATFS